MNRSLQEEQLKKTVQEGGGARAGTWENRYLLFMRVSVSHSVHLLSCALCVSQCCTLWLTVVCVCVCVLLQLCSNGS